MIALRCNIKRLVITDISPRVVFEDGLVTEIPLKIVQKSAMIKQAISKNELSVVPRGGPVRRVQDTQSPRPENPRHTLLIREIEVRDSGFSEESVDLLNKILLAIQDLGTKVEGLQSRQTVVHTTSDTHYSQAVDNTPVYIPSKIRTGEAETHITVESEEIDGVDEATEALRRLMK